MTLSRHPRAIHLGAMAAVASLAFLVSNVCSDLSVKDAARQARTYLYRPEVFADRPLGVGLPANPSILQGYLWYVRLEESARALLGMQALARFLQENRVPGIDFTNDRTLTTADVERLFQANLWMASPAAAGPYKFRFLKLAGTRVGDEALPTVGKLYDLEVLALGDKVSDRGLPWLKDLLHLKVLELTSPLITDQGIAFLSRLVELERLSLKGTAVSDQGLETLSNLPLKQLELGPGVTDRGLAVVAGIKSLRQLDLSRSHVTRSDLARLASIPGLHTLLLGPSVSDADLGALTALKNLKRLDLTGARISDAGADVLAAMPQLEELALTRTEIGNAALEKLSRLPHLRYLEVSDTRVTPEVFGDLHGFSALQVFSFSSGRRLSRRDIEPLSRIPVLHSILINGALLGPDAVDALRARLHQGGWLPRLVPEAQADSTGDEQVEQALEIAGAPAAKQRPRPFEGYSGLQRIHQAESALENVSEGSAPKIQVFEENEKNFLGEITVGAASSLGKNKKGG